MHLENGFASAHIRQIDGDLTVKTAGPQQRGIENVGPVGGRDDNDAFLGIEAVHLDQQGVERLLPFVVATAQAVSPAPSHGVNLRSEEHTSELQSPCNIVCRLTL